MNIAILGAAGRTGTEVVTQALHAGHEVTAFVRSPGDLPVTDGALTVVDGDAREEADVAKALIGVDAVISALGSMKSADQLATRSAAALVAAARQAGVERVVSMSSFLASPNYQPNFLGKLVAGMLRGTVADKSVGDATVAASGLDWTVVYATSLDKAKPGSAIRTVGRDETVSMSNGIARADVARFMLAEVTDTGHHRAAVLITSK